jgi:hypothetical protein
VTQTAVAQDIADIADELTEAHQHTEVVSFWDANRNRKKRQYRTVQPGLLAQLHEAAVDPVHLMDDVGGSSGKKPASRPPLAIEALSRWLDISEGVKRWCETLAITRRTTVESNIRAIVGCIGQLDADTLSAITEDMKAWRRWAAVMTGWETKVFSPSIACPVCETFRSIRINVTVHTGFCTECQHYWESDGLVDLALESQKKEAA